MTEIEKLELAHQQLQVGLKENEICIRDGIVLKIQPESRFPFEFFCWRSPEMVKEMDCFIKYSKGRKCLLDVGAFQGIFSMVFGKINPNYYAYAFEPSPIPAGILLLNSSSMPLIKPFNSALSTGTGIVNCHKEWDHLVIGGSENVKNDIKVVCYAGDRFCNINSLKPDTIKIDVEGHEIKVLRGLKETIVAHRPIIFLEVHPERMEKEGDTMDDLIKILMEYDYTSIVNSENYESINYNEMREFKKGEYRLILLPTYESYISNN